MVQDQQRTSFFALLNGMRRLRWQNPSGLPGRQAQWRSD